ncbi:antibiotic biosynthesis monooxygenase family protein [Chloroflexota bacterium]
MVRVIIERHVKTGKRGELMHLLRELRASGIHQPGYVTGETLANAEDDSIISVLSTWRSLKDWRAWGKSEPRIKLYKQIEPLLLGKPEVSIYEVMVVEEK